MRRKFVARGAESDRPLAKTVFITRLVERLFVTLLIPRNLDQYYFVASGKKRGI